MQGNHFVCYVTSHMLQRRMNSRLGTGGDDADFFSRESTSLNGYLTPPPPPVEISLDKASASLVRAHIGNVEHALSFLPSVMVKLVSCATGFEA